MAELSHQFKEMHRRLGEGGFTYDPRARAFVSSGFSVAAHPGAELKVTHAEGGVTPGDIRGFTKGSQPVWSQQKSRDRGQEMIGGWKDVEGGKDVLDLPKVFPATPAGHTKSRRAQILRNQEASWVLHEDRPDKNPWFTGSSTTPSTTVAQHFPEFANVVRKHPQAALDPERYPETAAWAEGPARRAQWAKRRS